MKNNPKEKKLLCQECCGYGYVEEVILITSPPAQYTCGWCNGTGEVSKTMRGAWLRDKKECKNI